jgi:hypothetical protein
MAELLVHKVQFHVRSWLVLHPQLVIVLGICSLVFIISMLTAIVQSRRHSEAFAELRMTLSEQKKEPPLLAHQSQLQSGLSLPLFNSASLIESLHSAAEEAKLPIDEVSYSLEENLSQPYLRYRITLTATATYPAIRHFTDGIRRQANHVSLDTITCSREDIAAASLSCDLGLSAFYRKGGHG